jgi:drug/metabolite transporter (DMT)-like permease
MGTLVLREPFGQQKVLGAALIFLGILCIGMA